MREWASLELRWVGDSRPGGGAARPTSDPRRSRLWIRTNGRLDDPLVHLAAFTYASDLTLLGSSLVPHGVQVADPSVQSASLDHTIWFHRPFRADEWLLYDQASPSASGARGLAIGRVHRGRPARRDRRPGGADPARRLSGRPRRRAANYTRVTYTSLNRRYRHALSVCYI